MKKAAIIAHTSDRQVLLSRMLGSIKETGALSGWKIYLIGHGYDAETNKALRRLDHIDVLDEVKIYGKWHGPHHARVQAFDRWEADVWCMLDDDMVLLPVTDYEAAVEKAMNPLVGLVATSNQRGEGLVCKGYAKGLEGDRFRDQIIVCTGGGMVYRDEVARMVQEMPRRPYLYDTVSWSIMLYVRGYMNCRDFHSWAVHVAGSMGGQRTWYPLQDDKELWNEAHLRMRPETKKKYFQEDISEAFRVRWPVESEVTKKAHDLHRRARGALEEQFQTEVV